MCLSTICIPKVAWYTYFLRLTRSFGAPKSIGDGCSSPFLQVAALQGLMSNECSVEHHMAGYIVLEGYRRSVPIPIPAPLPLGCCKGPRSGHNYLSVYSFMWQQCNEVKLSSEAKRFSQMILLHWPSIKYAIKYGQLCLWSSEPLLHICLDCTRSKSNGIDVIPPMPNDRSLRKYQRHSSFWKTSSSCLLFKAKID